MKLIIKIILLLAPVIFCGKSALGEDTTKPQPGKDIPAVYYIDARLDTSAKTLTGSETVYFQNPTNIELDVIVFHLYPNAFSDTLTLLAKNKEPVKDAIERSPGYIKCDSIIVDGHEPDSVVVDETLLYIYPELALKPARTSKIALKFEIKIPPLAERFGYDNDGNYLFAHWQPILVGYQKDKAIIYQYGSDGEFFSNFAYYEVKLQIPHDFEIVSTSNINKPDSSTGDIAYYTLPAKRVIDFAFACGPAWVAESYYHNNIEICLLLKKENAGRLDKIKGYIDKSLDYFGEMLFPYPYPNLCYADINTGAGGMEVPRMVAMPFSGNETASVRQLPATIIHETAHQWFYATVATNEFDEAWLDEGLVTYLTDRALTAITGDDYIFDFYGIKISNTELGALVGRLTDYRNPLDTPSDSFYPGSYFDNVYGRASATIKTLEGVLGTSVFDKALKDYAIKYKFYHPDSHDFEKSFETSSGRELNWFFESFIFGTKRVDYQVSSLKYEKSESLYTSTVEVLRKYDGVLPQVLVIGFEDGTKQSTNWDGIARYRQFEFEYKNPPIWAAIDTGGNYLIDEDFADNSLRISPASGSSFAFSEILGMLMQILFILAGLL